MLIANTPLASYRIILPAAAMEGERDVAEVLRDTLTRATGVTLEIAADDTPATDYEIVIGKTTRDTDKVTAARAEIQNDGYALVVDGGDLYVSATTGRGVVYGMMELLEQYLGVRLYARDFIHYRPLGHFSLEEGFKQVFNPAFHARRTWVDNLYSDPLEQVIFLRNNSDGLKKAKVGDTYPIRANSNHTIDDLAKVEGEGQVPCLTDEAVYAQVLKSVRKKLDNSPDT